MVIVDVRGDNIPWGDKHPVRAADLTRISHKEIRKIAITPILLRCGGDSGSVTYYQYAPAPLTCRALYYRHSPDF